MAIERAVLLTNRGMVAFDLALGAGALLAPAATMRLIGHEEPTPEARHLFRRCAPVWLTYAAAHALAARRGSSGDWQALAWLRGSEILTDALWARSPSLRTPRAQLNLHLAAAANAAMAAGFAWMARRTA